MQEVDDFSDAETESFKNIKYEDAAAAICPEMMLSADLKKSILLQLGQF